MDKKYKVFVSALSIVFSLLAAGSGFFLVLRSDLSFFVSVLYNFIFLLQFISTIWVIIAMFRKK